MTEDEAATLKPGDRVTAWLSGFEGERAATVVGFDGWGHVIISLEFPVRVGQIEFPRN